ncbi:HAD family hydrolase [Brevibacillus fluminis]|uniref:HAD family hydrolase n=1 Tax=Brevibacillus fluminis TaxID=511487 RepID=A0A3M8DBJ9_9BACL|nr:HAD family hydrolase [Brevibacillus fluminis]RNB84647.1 HAD family hydrolase [Brevibacillus fluminis]
MKRQGIIFDMDNTLLQSSIDFPKMKRTVYELLVEFQLCEPTLEWQGKTASQLIELGRQSGRLTPSMEQRIWDEVGQIEKEGMHGAKLENNVVEVLTQLKNNHSLVILTNNASIAAEEALRETGIVDLFDAIYAREHMTALKPSPSGILSILGNYPNLGPDDWIMIGDSWIDGKAAQDARVDFIAYRGKPDEMERHYVSPIAWVQDCRDLLALPYFVS